MDLVWREAWPRADPSPLEMSFQLTGSRGLLKTSSYMAQLVKARITHTGRRGESKRMASRRRGSRLPNHRQAPRAASDSHTPWESLPGNGNSLARKFFFFFKYQNEPYVNPGTQTIREEEEEG